MKRPFFTSLLLFIIVSFSVQSAKWRVNNTVGIDADFTSFKAAHDAAAPGDTLMFEGSNAAYGTNDTLFKRLVIIGPGYFLSENDLTNDNILPAQLGKLYIDSLAAGSKIMGMSIVGGFDALMVDASNIIIERNRINSTIAFCYEKAVHNVVVSKNFCGEIDTRWGSNTEIATGLIVVNNIVTGTISFNNGTTATIMNNSVGADIIVNNSVVKNNISGYLNAREGTVYEYNIVNHAAPAGTGNKGNVALADIYVAGVSSTDGEWALSETSTAKRAGEGFVDCGAFGGTDAYILSGFPPMPVVFNVEIPATATESLMIKLQAKSQK